MSKRAAVRLEGVALVVLLALVSCGGTIAPEADHGQADRYRERYLRMRTYGSAEELAEDADAIVVATVFGQGRGEPLARGVEVAHRTVQVDDTLRGPLGLGQDVDVSFVSVDDDGRWPDLVVGEQYLLFLREPEAGADAVEYTLVGDWAGMFAAAGGDRFTRLEHRSSALPEELSREQIAAITEEDRQQGDPAP